jgi:transcriptional regulator with XRE-family HTH domain
MKEAKTPRGRLLRRARTLLQCNQRQMALAMGVDPATVSQWETGARRIPTHRLDRLLLLVLEADHVEKDTQGLLAAIREERRYA